MIQTAQRVAEDYLESICGSFLIHFNIKGRIRTTRWSKRRTLGKGNPFSLRSLCQRGHAQELWREKESREYVVQTPRQDWTVTRPTSFRNCVTATLKL